uniref:Transmembrane protein 45B n=1 Tax=Tetradesmus obliquus TaxID=3088 RepID=A0A383W5U1_TETOB|eukprot:jgi/Sobl393_1/10732/SZX72590.1
MDAHSHAGHAHGASHPATSISELQHPPHGSYEGHVVPGVMFIIWSTYWIWSVLDIHLRTRAAGLHTYLPLHTNSTTSSSSTKQSGSRTSSSHCSSGRGEPFRSRAWYPWPYWPAKPMEPIIKVLFCLLGVFIELYVGFRGWRPLYKADGHFAEFHANNWQHALMYSSFAVSGVIDLIGYFTPLPPGTEQGFLSLSFLVETLLMGMHAKPNELDQLVHTLLTWIMVACIVISAAEIAAPQSLLLALLRGMLVFFQGTWFWHVGAIMFKDSMAWDMNDMGGVMFVPVVFCLHMLLICLGTFSAYLFMRWLYVRLGISSSAHLTANQLAASPAGKASLLGSHHVTHHGSGPAAHDMPEADLDLLLEGQLELTDMYGSSSSGGGVDAAGHGRDSGVRGSKRSHV